MGRRGPPPKPTKIRLIEGNPSKRPINKKEPQPPAISDLRSAKAPAFLSGMISRRIWNQDGPLLIDLGILSRIDLTQFAAYCESAETYIEAHQKIRKMGMMIVEKRGKTSVLVRNPYLKIRRDAKAEMLRYAQEFGLTPSARSRISITEAGEKDDFESFLSGKDS